MDALGRAFPSRISISKVNYSHKLTESRRFKSQNERFKFRWNIKCIFPINNAFLMFKKEQIRGWDMAGERQRFTWTVAVHLKWTWKYFYPPHRQNKTLRLSFFCVLTSQRLKGKCQHAACFSPSSFSHRTWRNVEKRQTRRKGHRFSPKRRVYTSESWKKITQNLKRSMRHVELIIWAEWLDPSFLIPLKATQS